MLKCDKVKQISLFNIIFIYILYLNVIPTIENVNHNIFNVYSLNYVLTFDCYYI